MFFGLISHYACFLRVCFHLIKLILTHFWWWFIVVSLIVANDWRVEYVKILWTVVSIKHCNIIDSVHLLGIWSAFLSRPNCWSETCESMVCERVSNSVVLFMIRVSILWISRNCFLILLHLSLHVILGSAWPCKRLITKTEIKTFWVMDFQVLLWQNWNCKHWIFTNFILSSIWDEVCVAHSLLSIIFLN